MSSSAWSGADAKGDMRPGLTSGKPRPALAQPLLGLQIWVGFIRGTCGVRRVVGAGTVSEASVEKYQNGDHFYFASGPTSPTSTSDLLLTFRCAPGMNL